MRDLTIEMGVYRTHIPVLLKESTDLLMTSPDGIYVDATLGGGGHSGEILSHLSGEGRLYAIDQDPEAIAEVRRTIGLDPRFTILQGNFAYMDSLLPADVIGGVDGVLFDLGVSTHQIREPERGFSFQEEGPLDMRMSDETSLTAAQVVNEYEPAALQRILFQYGEEKLSKPIVRAIVNARPVLSTRDLRRIVETVVKGPFAIKSVARVFQAIRIEVNQEMEKLRQALDAALAVLAPGGRIVAISYHSLEDRIVKTFFKCGNHEGVVEKDFYGHPQCPLVPLSRDIITPSKQEVEQNPASRSAKLRVAVKTDGGR